MDSPRCGPEGVWAAGRGGGRNKAGRLEREPIQNALGRASWGLRGRWGTQLPTEPQRGRPPCR